MERTARIPWILLTTHLRYGLANTTHKEQATNLISCFQETQGDDWNAFVKSFTQSIAKHSNAERKRYSQRYDPPDPNNILLNDDVVKRISPMIHRLDIHWALSSVGGYDRFLYSIKLCSHEKNDPTCTCPVPYEERKASSFLRQKHENDCDDFYEINHLGYFNMEVVKTLLVSGDMEPILKICAHPDNDIRSWWSLSECLCFPSSLGWDQVYLRALETYVCLNVLYRFPALRDDKTDEQDYRRTSCYQKLLRNIAIHGTAAVGPLHLDFFGIAHDQFSDSRHPREDGAFAHLGKDRAGMHRDYPFGIMPIHDFLEFEILAPHVPTAPEVDQVSRMLGEKGLPYELRSHIMELADYEPRRRQQVPHDPFHKDNRSELEKYISVCWEVLVRCDMMAKAIGNPIEWDVLVSKCIADLWGPNRQVDEALSEKMYRGDDRGLYTFL